MCSVNLDDGRFHRGVISCCDSLIPCSAHYNPKCPGLEGSTFTLGRSLRDAKHGLIGSSQSKGPLTYLQMCCWLRY